MANTSNQIRITYQHVFLLLLILLAIIIFAAKPLYIINEGDQAVITRFGKVIDTKTDAGLQFKLPVVDKVTMYSKKILSWDGAPHRIPTFEKQFIWVDPTARWQIVDPAKFYASTNTMTQAYARLDDLIESAIRTVITQNKLVEAVRNTNNILDSQGKNDEAFLPQEESNAKGDEVEQTLDQEADYSIDDINNLVSKREEQASIEKGRKKLSDEMLLSIKETAPEFGIKIIDIVIRQIRYSDDLTESVYNRMISERKQKAQIYRSFGEGRKQEWLGQLENEKKSILSQAYSEAETIKGKADAQAAQIYSEAYRESEGFFKFWRAMESYRKTVPKMDKVLSTDLEYFNYLYDSDGRNR